jgi:hypothetical protein
MSEQDNIKVVQEAYAAFEQGDVERITSLFAEDANWIMPGPTDVIPSAGARQGREQIAQYFSVLAETEDIEEFVPKFFVAQDERVITFGRTLSRVKATKRSYETEWTQVFTFADGKIVNFREFYDTAAAAEAHRG